MNLPVIIAYGITILLVLYGGTMVLISLISGLSGRLFRLHILLAFFTGSLSTWIIINGLWGRFAGGQISVALCVACFLILGTLVETKKDELNETAKMMISSEMFAIVIMCAYTMIVGDSIRWY